MNVRERSGKLLFACKRVDGYALQNVAHLQPGGISCIVNQKRCYGSAHPGKGPEDVCFRWKGEGSTTLVVTEGHDFRISARSGWGRA